MIDEAKRRVIYIEALTPAEERIAWPELLNFAVTGVQAMPCAQDRAPADAVQGERRHQIWMDAGTWQGHLYFERNTSLGTCEALIDGSTMGTIVTAGTGNDMVTAFGTQVVVNQPGLHWVTIRKTVAQIRIMRLSLRRTV